MGRKPNQLILEFFDRGQKLEDASNRYQHTCKACGERFPKGRIDSLTTHLVKKCPAIALRDRQRALLQLHELPDIDTSEIFKDESTRNENTPRGVIGKGQTMDLPIANAPWTALETLAEVSRQMGGPEKGKKVKKSTQAASAANQAKAVANENSTQEIVENNTENHGKSIATRERTKLIRIEMDHSLPPINFFPSLSNSPAESPHLPSISMPMSNADADKLRSSLSLTAQSANELQATLKPGMPMEPGLPDLPGNASISDKFFHRQGLPPRNSATWPSQQDASIDPTFFENPEDQAALIEATATRAATFPRPIAINPNTPQRDFTSEFGTSRPSRPKVRGRFSASRRKEVQEVRKRGACIRCRMLKKPCSGESPCSTCRNVESARLWKQPCIRTRIADELQIYSAGLHGVLAHQDVLQARAKFKIEQSPNVITASHYPETSIFATFNMLQGHRTGLEDLSEIFNGTQLDDDVLAIKLLDTELEDVPGRLEQYMRIMADTFYEREASPFLRETLAVASKLAGEKQDPQLGRALELWAANHVLIDIDMRWIIFETVQTGTGITRQVPLDSELDSYSYQLICSQLRGLVEKRAAQISKTVMNDLERRLLQRAQGGWFETFLASILLLNCVERSCWLFQTWYPQDFQAKWPLDRGPNFYFEQGEHFADMLHMLLKMRNLPPKTHIRVEDNVIVAEGDELVQDYFDKIRLTSQLLEARKDATFDAINSRCFELKLCSKLLLPS